MVWKGKKSSRIIYRGRENQKRSYIIRQAILNNSDKHTNLRENPYTGFLIFSRKYCGVDFFEALSDGSISIGLLDYDWTYDVRAFFLTFALFQILNSDSVGVKNRFQPEVGIRVGWPGARSSSIQLLIASG